jgi:hypothetical protein
VRLSSFFEELKSAYEAELDDLTTDSAGHDVLAKRLQAKRGHVSQLLPMIECNPEMVAVAFHGGMRFDSPEVMRDLAAQEPEDLPSWSELLESVQLEPWADDAGQTLSSRTRTASSSWSSPRAWSTCSAVRRSSRSPATDRRRAPAGVTAMMTMTATDSDDEVDLEEAGADWLSEQGFDRSGSFLRGPLMSHPVLAKAANLIRVGDIVGAEAALVALVESEGDEALVVALDDFPCQGSAGGPARLRCVAGVGGQPPGFTRAVCPRHRPRKALRRFRSRAPARHDQLGHFPGGSDPGEFIEAIGELEGGCEVLADYFCERAENIEYFFRNGTFDFFGEIDESAAEMSDEERLDALQMPMPMPIVRS